MNTKIELTHKGVNYTLEYNRASVKTLEANGFNVDDILTKPMTNIDLLFQGAFIKNHPKISIATISEILDECPDKNGLLVALKKMVDETYESLLQSNDSGNVSWKIVDLSPVTTTSQK